MTFADGFLILLLAHHAMHSVMVASLYLLWPLRRPGDGIYAYLELWAFYFMNITLPLGLLTPRRMDFSLQSDPEDPRNAPVIFLHGYMMNDFCMLPMRLYLAGCGFRRLYGLSLKRPFGSIETFAWQLRDFIFEVEKRNPGRQVWIVAHSMGGLVAAQALQDKRVARMVKGIIALGSPFGGSELYHVGAGACARQFRPGGVFLRQMASRLEGEAGRKLISIYSDGDRMVCPPESSHVRGARVNEKLRGLGHLSLLLSLDVFRRVYWHLFERGEAGLEHLGEERDLAAHP